MMIDEEEARQRAEAFVKEYSLETELAIVPGVPARREDILYFHCQSAEYVRTGNWRHMAVGTGPIAVDLTTGECAMIGPFEAAELGL